MAQVEIASEREDAAGWTFVVRVLDDRGALREHSVTLSWVDYNLWSGSGADEPADVAAAVVGFMLSRAASEDLRPSFDASIARRLYPDADKAIPKLI